MYWNFQHDIWNSSFKSIQALEVSPFFIPSSYETDTFQRLMLSRRLVFFTSSYHYLKTMQLFLLGSHCILFSLVVIKPNIKNKKEKSGRPSLCFCDDLLLFMSVSSWSAAFLGSSSCAEMQSVFFICPYYSTVLLFNFQSSITNLVSCRVVRACWRTTINLNSWP